MMKMTTVQSLFAVVRRSSTAILDYLKRPQIFPVRNLFEYERIPATWYLVVFEKKRREDPSYFLVNVVSLYVLC